jgi:hypothetical protein
MLEAAIWLAASFAVVAAASGDRAARALLASFALCVVLETAGVQFNFIFWLMIDIAVAMATIHRAMTFRDVYLIALFIPAWGFYLTPDEARYVGVSLILIAQFLLTFPVSLAGSITTRPAQPEKDTTTMRMIRHG